MKQFSKDLGNVCIAPKGKWSREQEYERLALVYNACDNLSYVAKINVPSGVDIENREYWQPMNATGYADNNFINLTTENENGTVTAYESLEEAVATILPINRRAGATLSFYNLNSDRPDRQSEFELWQFNSTDLANWENRDYWNNIYYNWNVFAGWYVGADALKNHVKIPNVGQYAYVGTNLNDALLYQCRTNGVWTNTGIKVRNYMSVVVSGNITIGDNGNWFSNGEDTGIPATPAVDEQLDNIIIQLQQHATEIDELQKQDISLKRNIDSNFETINNKVDNIKTATDNKIDTADANLQNQIISNDNDIATLNTKHESLSKTVQGIAVTGGASTATNVTYNNDSSRLNAENAQDAIDELQSSKFDKTSILQESGEAEDKVISQKAVSTWLSHLNIKQKGLIDIQRYSNVIFDTSKFNNVGERMPQGGIYTFGQDIDEQPTYKSETAILTKAVFNLDNLDSRPLLVLLENTSNAAIGYRSYAIFDKDNNIVKEEITSGNEYLLIKNTCTIIASCSAIKSTDYGYLEKKYIYSEIERLNADIAKKFDKSSVVQESGDAKDKVMSQKAVSDLFNIDACVNIIDNCQGIDISKLEDASSIVTKCEINGIYNFGQSIDEEPIYKTDSVKTYKLEITNLTNGSNNRLLFYVKNLNVGNNTYRSWAIYAGDNNKLIKEGTVTFLNADTAFFVTGIGNWYDKITILFSCEGDGVFYYGNNYQMFKYDIQKHIQQLETRPTITKLLSGKTIWTLWDSLGENTWQSKFVEESGATFYSDLNTKIDKPISAGGTASSPYLVAGSQQRAINLVSYKDTYPIDILFIENINDNYFAITNKGTINDEPFMRSQLLTYQSDIPCTTYEEAKNLFDSSFQTILSSFQGSKRKVGTILSIPYIANGSDYYGTRIKFTGTASKEGDISININGVKSIHVNTETSLSEIISMFMKYNYGSGWTARDNGDNSISICYYTTTDQRATFDDGGTGVTVEISDTSYNGAYLKYFMSKDINSWTEKDKWADDVSLYSIYKGMLGYLQRNLLDTKIYWVLPEYFSIDFSSNLFKDEDGTLSIDKYRKNSLYTNKVLLYGIQKEVCELFNIPVIDLRLESGLNLFNSEKYFNPNNPHPKQIGYDKYAEGILNFIK